MNIINSGEATGGQGGAECPSQRKICEKWGKGENREKKTKNIGKRGNSVRKGILLPPPPGLVTPLIINYNISNKIDNNLIHSSPLFCPLLHINPLLTKGVVTTPSRIFLSPQNQKESDDLSHVGNLNYILYGHFDGKKKE